MFAEDTNRSATIRKRVVDTNLSSGIPVVATNTTFQATTVEPGGMLIKISYQSGRRCDSDKPPTNGCIIAEVAGPRSSTSFHWLGPRRRDIFKIALRDEAYEQAAFTGQGKHFGSATTTVHSPLYNTYVLFLSGTNQLEELIHFDIDDVFFVRHSGRYELEMIPQLCWCSNLNTDTFNLSNLPAIKLTLQLTTNVSPH